MKAFILSFLFAFANKYSYAQGVTGNRGTGMFLRSYFTTPFEAKTRYSGVEGSPFVDENWSLARLYVDSVQYFDSVKIRINVFENRIHFMDEQEGEFQATDLFLQVIIIDNTSQWFRAVFRSGYYQQPHTYFHVLQDGNKAQLLQKFKVEKWVTKAIFEESKTIFQIEKELLINFQDKLFKQNKDCVALRQLMDSDAELSQFIKDNALKCNKEADLKRVVHFINAK